MIAFQPVLQVSQAGTVLVSLVDFSYHLCLLRDDAEFFVFIFFIPIESVAGNLERPDVCVHLPTAPDVAGDGFAFGLRHRTIHRDHELAVRRQGVDVFFLEEDTNAKLSEDGQTTRSRAP